ncbi:hypothetical protein [Methermicoccus shengliensis]|uniref:Uncharacterized protein n=1 Tax=Methermicoccus shengliensis TaxID=660064 RepID=A0A832VWQ4_9EURY|nr:hypothetical protein [Methermicoccus shengliensis]KUK04675.1 MAG: Uncharacterized protein XD46_0652 [Euryarchaeota archaeon 55_53]KUK29612.1 MAG: Uncharacterized protein XD62_1320 [Methanosarcinales archeaon 56_1174]MDI3487931.1 hypothetical protein [Methanosarcinales archaeon]MDN5295069.1 hypothetical protein [Methanosarcinales archaeon]HIH69093.1 hypothetical protein [Methermicoccus shengliensis]
MSELLRALVLLLVGCATLSTGCVQPQEPTYLNESLRIAEQFIRTAPTFAYDGDESTLTLVDSNQLSPSSWEFTFTFQSRTAGYGNRAGMMVAQVLTNHTAVIRVEDGDVVYAVYDGVWDELNQRMIEE